MATLLFFSFATCDFLGYFGMGLGLINGSHQDWVTRERDGRLLLVQIQCSQLEIVDDARFTPIYAKKNYIDENAWNN